MNDLDLLTPDLSQASLSNREIVLNYSQVFEAIDQLAASGYAVTSWEDWLLYPDGKKGHSAQHQGSRGLERLTNEDTPAFLNRETEFTRRTIQQAHLESEQYPEHGNTVLYYCPSVEPYNSYQ